MFKAHGNVPLGLSVGGGQRVAVEGLSMYVVTAVKEDILARFSRSRPVYSADHLPAITQ